MRKDFAAILHDLMSKDKDIFFLTGDLGMFVLDDLKKDYPDRFINCGASEQAMLDIAVGLSYAGKKAICYSISPFTIFRPFETIRTYIDHENLPILLVGSGRNSDYAHDGWSHDATDISFFLNHFKNVRQCYPADTKELEVNIQEWYQGTPMFLSLKK
jgi:transketolase